MVLTNYELTFNSGDTKITHTINITDDDACEYPFEEFFCSMSLLSGDPRISIVQAQATVIIVDSNEQNCGMIILINMHEAQVLFAHYFRFCESRF